MRFPLQLTLGVGVVAAAAGFLALRAQDTRPTSKPAKTESGKLPPEFKQLLPRGRIAGIRAPSFVKADQARIDPNTWVMGVVVEGKARAYSLNLLNRHEVVNDTAGKTHFAAVW